MPRRRTVSMRSLARKDRAASAEVDFTLPGQRFMALNGGTRFEYTHAISKRAMAAVMQMVKLAIAGLKRAYEGKSVAYGLDA